jgi:Transposase DDE domain
MRIVAQVAAAMQAVFGTSIDDLARTTRCVQRQRKFSGASLARTLVLAVLLRPAAKNRDFQAMAAKLGVHVTEEAIDRRFTNELVTFLEEILQQAVSQALAAKAATTPLLQKFSDVRIGDSTNLMLPDEFADRFPGCGGTENACLAAMKIQVLWSLLTGRLLGWQITPGRASDAKSEIAEVLPPAGSLSVFDLGYFSLDRFRRVGEADAYWISRLQHGTKVFDAAGKNLDLQSFLRKRGESGLVDATVVLGEQDRLACRLIAVRVPAEVASRRRQKVREKARDHGREPSQEYLELQEWTIFVTNCDAELLTWKEVVVAYRARWQIELLFKLWKSHNRMAALETVASPQRQMAVLYAKLIGVIVQHWMLLSAAWSDIQRSLRKAAAILRDWIVLLTGVLDDGERLRDFLRRFGAAVTKTARVTRRRKHPSLFQLLENPELLEYTLA